MKTIALLVLCLAGLSCKSSSAEEIHARLHVAWATSEPIFDELVALENDPDLTEKFGKVQVAAHSVHLAFEAYIAASTSENASKLQAALAAASAAADGVIAAFAGDSDDAHRARLYAKLLLALVQAASAEVPTVNDGAPGDGTLP